MLTFAIFRPLGKNQRRVTFALPVEVFDRVVVEKTVRKRAKSVAVIRLPLSQPLSYQIVEVGGDEGFHALVAQNLRHTKQNLKKRTTSLQLCLLIHQQRRFQSEPFSDIFSHVFLYVLVLWSVCKDNVVYTHLWRTSLVGVSTGSLLTVRKCWMHGACDA